MSQAADCDVCGTLFKPTPGTIHIAEINIATVVDGEFDSWSELDLCVTCSERLLAVIKPALRDLDKPKL